MALDCGRQRVLFSLLAMHHGLMNKLGIRSKIERRSALGR